MAARSSSGGQGMREGGAVPASSAVMAWSFAMEIAMAEMFCKRRGRKAPLALLSFFSHSLFSRSLAASPCES
jgi:hypothetical protein